MSETAKMPEEGGSANGVVTPPATHSPAAEVARLTKELQQCQEKFASWKDKAKSGVENLRAQIIELNQRLEQSEQRRVADGRSCSVLQTSTSACSDLISEHAVAAACLLADVLNAHCEASLKAAAAGYTSSPPLPSQDGLVKKLERTIQEQSDRLKETHHALKRSTNEVQQRVDALQRQDEVVATLRRRVETLEATNNALEEQLMHVPNVDEWRAAQDELDHQLKRSRLEYENRESTLVLQHSNEVQALNAAHEQDIRELLREAEERTAVAVQNALASQALAFENATAVAQQQEQDQHQRGTDDVAYLDLLRDYKALEASSSAAVRECEVMRMQRKTLLRELHDLFRAIGSGGISGGASTLPLAAGGADTLTVEAAVQQMGEQRMRCLALQDDLSRCRREVQQLKRSKPSTPADGLGSQQTQYLRSVVVQLLCSLHDATVAKRLLPVLSMLLKFSDDDLKAVTKAMPQWTQSHR